MNTHVHVQKQTYRDDVGCLCLFLPIMLSCVTSRGVFSRWALSLLNYLSQNALDLHGKNCFHEITNHPSCLLWHAPKYADKYTHTALLPANKSSIKLHLDWAVAQGHLNSSAQTLIAGFLFRYWCMVNLSKDVRFLFSSDGCLALVMCKCIHSSFMFLFLFCWNVTVFLLYSIFLFDPWLAESVQVRYVCADVVKLSKFSAKFDNLQG